MAYLSCRLFVYRGNAWASVIVDEIPEFVFEREALFSMLESDLADKLSEYAY